MYIIYIYIYIYIVFILYLGPFNIIVVLRCHEIGARDALRFRGRDRRPRHPAPWSSCTVDRDGVPEGARDR